MDTIFFPKRNNYILSIYFPKYPIHLHIFFPILVSDYSTQQLSDRSDKQQQDYQQQFGLMNDQVMDSVQTGNINGAGHPSEFSPRGGGGEGTLSFPAASSKASFSVHSEYILFWIRHPKMTIHFCIF